MYTPVDLENITFRSGVIGYDKNEVMEFISAIYTDFDKLYKENISLKDKNNLLSDAIKEYKAMEVALRDTVVSAHNISDEIKKSAHKEAELIIIGANNKKDEMLNEAKAELNTINVEIASLKQEYSIFKSKIRGLVHAQNEILDNFDKEHPTDGRPIV